MNKGVSKLPLLGVLVSSILLAKTNYTIQESAQDAVPSKSETEISVPLPEKVNEISPREEVNEQEDGTIEYVLVTR
ncbi:hypothetical protein ACFL38_02635 [Candidatus Omnitrophota bacterium]